MLAPVFTIVCCFQSSYLVNKYVEREVEVLPQPALAQDVAHVGHQADLPLAVDLVEEGGHRHVAQAVAGKQILLSVSFYPKPHQGKTINVKKKTNVT